MKLFSMRLFLGELRSLLSRPRARLVAGVVVGIGAANIYRTRDGYLGQVSWWVVLRYGLSPVKVLLPLLIAGAAGTMVAEHRRSGFDSLVLVRSADPVAYVLSSLAASMLTAAVLVLVPVGVVGSFARAIAPAAGTVSVPVPIGFPRSPLLLSLVPAFTFAAGAVFLAGLATVTALLTTNAVAVVAVPALVFLLGSALPAGLAAWNPWTHLEMGSDGPSLLATMAYWTFGALAVTAASVAIALRRRAS